MPVDTEIVRRTVITTFGPGRGAAGPSGRDADPYRAASGAGAAARLAQLAISQLGGLGLGSAAFESADAFVAASDIGTSGDKVPLLSGVNVFSAAQTFDAVVKAKTVHATGSEAPVGGSGVEIQGGSTGVLNFYNRNGGAYISAFFDAAIHIFRVGGSERMRITDAGMSATGSIRPSSYTVSTVPSAAAHQAGAMIYVSNEAGGAVIAFSDATNWRRVTDRNIIS